MTSDPRRLTYSIAFEQNIETTDRIVDTDGLVDLRGKYEHTSADLIKSGPLIF